MASPDRNKPVRSMRNFLRYWRCQRLGESMNKWKVAFFVVLILGLASNGYLFYNLVDSGISYGYFA